MDIPEWLKKVFLIFTVNYKNLWTDSFLDEQICLGNDILWLKSLKGYSPHIILKAAEQAIKVHKYPPSIAEFIELATALQREENYEMKRKEYEKNRLLEKEPDKEIAKRYIKQIMGNLGKKSTYVDH